MSNSGTRVSRFSHLRELPARPFASSRCPVLDQANNIAHGIRLGADIWQHARADRNSPTSQCIPFPGLSFGKHVRLCIKHTFHMSHGSIHPIRKIATLPIRPVPPANGSPAPSYMMGCIPRGNPAGRRDYDPAIRPTQPSYRLPSHPFTPAPSLLSPRTWVWVLSVDCGSPRRVPLYTTREPVLRSICYKSQLRRFGPFKLTPPPAGRQHSDFLLVTCRKTKRSSPLFPACFWLTGH